MNVSGVVSIQCKADTRFNVEGAEASPELLCHAVATLPFLHPTFPSLDLMLNHQRGQNNPSSLHFDCSTSHVDIRSQTASEKDNGSELEPEPYDAYLRLSPQHTHMVILPFIHSSTSI